MVNGPLELANLALSNIGLARIRSFNDGTQAAVQCNAFYDAARREFLALPTNWRFATIKARLEPSTYSPVEARWSVVYRYPARCLRFIGVVDVFATFGDEWTAYPDYTGEGRVTLEVGEQSGLVGIPQSARIGPDGYGLSEISLQARGRLRKWATRTFRNAQGGYERVILTNLPDGVGEWVEDVEDLTVWAPQAVIAFSWLLSLRVAPLLSSDQVQRAAAVYRRTLSEAEVSNANEDDDRRVEKPSWMVARKRGAYN